MQPALDIKGLCKTYNNGFVALKNIALRIEAGDFFALLGANGAGKSTAIGIISSLINKTKGSVQVFGHDLDTERSTVKSLIGLVPQEFNFNIFEPIIEIITHQGCYYGLSHRMARQRAKDLLHQLALWDKRREMAGKLSGGMKRRLMIARALVHQPKLLILDEPTAGVDIEIRRSMWQFLQKINQAGTTIILTTHYLEEAESLCHHIAIIDQGKVIESTSMKTLLGRLNTETYLFDLLTPLSKIPISTKFQLKLHDRMTLEITLSKKCTLNELFDYLSHQKIKIHSMRNKSNRLEQSFVDLIERNKP